MNFLEFESVVAAGYSNAADGQKPLMELPRLLAAADLRRYAAQITTWGVVEKLFVGQS